MTGFSKKRTNPAGRGMALAGASGQHDSQLRIDKESIPMNFASKAAALAAVTAVALASGIASAADGKGTYDKVCTVCHASGVANAPKYGDKAAWGPRIAQGKDALFNSVNKGKGAMPPRAGNADLKDEDIKAAIDYMVAAAK
jgi:cytochrome c5